VLIMPIPSPRFQGPRTAIMLVFAGFGASVGGWAGSIPLINRNAEISTYDFGISLTAATIATVITMGLCGKLGNHVSNRKVLLSVIPCIAIAALVLFTAGSAPVFVASLIVFSLLLGICDVFMNAEASAIEQDLRKPIFTAFHGAASLGMAVFGILSSVISTLYGLTFTWLLVAICFAAAWGWTYTYVPARARIVEHQGLAAVSKAARFPLIVMGLITGLSISVETSAMFWSAKLLDEQAPALAAITGIGVAFFGLCTAIMRFSGDYLRGRFGEIRLLLVSISVSIAGLLGLGFSTNFAASTISFAAMGFGLAIICPCLFNMATTLTPHNRAAGISFISAIAGVPRIMAPFVFGWIATTSSTSTAFGLCAVIMLAAAGLVFVLSRYAKR
jgi:MFS family permease